MEPIITTVEELKKTLDADVVVLRGLPGSGKSSFAKVICNHTDSLCNADQFHIIDGIYQWTEKNNIPAHKTCLRDFIYCIVFETYLFGAPIIVDNTNNNMSQIETYLKIATAYDLKTAVVCFNVSPETSFKRNVHGVPMETIETMAKNIEKSRPHLLGCCKRLGVEYYEIDGEQHV